MTDEEKEAEEKYCKGCKLRMEQCLWAWRKTNGLDEPNEKNCSCKKVPAYIAGAEFGYNKANEWHYVKDELPTEDDVYLIYTTRGVLLGHYEQGGADGETNFRGVPYSDFTEYPSERLFTEDEIIAWKEIVLPELKETE